MGLKYEDIIKQMTLEEKASLCDGLDYWHTEPIERLNIPSVALNDGPHGIRKKDDPEAVKKGESGILKGVPAVCFPTASATACSWDPDLIKKMGEYLGDECRKEKVSVLLGPGTNIKRSPLCGRNFEYFSEDPYLAGEMASSFIEGVQSKGIGTSLKHFAVNNQETRRMTVSAVVDERALREIYLTPFEIAVKKSQPWTCMCSYNRVNGTYASEHEKLLNKILRDEWGFEGIVVTDWGAENNRVDGLKAGQDLEMPTSSGDGAKLICDAVKNGTLDEKVLDKTVDRLLDLVKKSEEVLKENYTYDAKEHHEIAREIAEQCIVLMKNNNKLLPFSKKDKIAVIGEMARTPRYQGAGSSLINPINLDNMLSVLTKNGIDYTFSEGYSLKHFKKKSEEKYIEDAVSKAKSAEKVLLFVGLTDAYETEGNDRSHICIPREHIRLIHEVSKVNKNVAVVLCGGSVVDMQWSYKVPAILNALLTGEASASAIYNIVFGKVNPSGKLAETYPVKLGDTPCNNYFPGAPLTTEYRESIYVGYRYYDKVKKPVRFPFGHGLSYTEFEYSDLKLSRKSMKDTDTLTVTFKVKNVGEMAGSEIAELYIKDNESTIFRPEKELKGFKKVYLEPNEEKKITIKLSKRAFAYYNVNLGDWHVETGDFTVLVGASSRDIRLEGTVKVKSTVKAEIPNYKNIAPSYYSGKVQNVPDNEFKELLGFEIPQSHIKDGDKLTILNTIEDSQSKCGKALNSLLKTVLGEETMAGAVARQTPIKNFISMSFGLFSEQMGDGLLDILNDDDLKNGLKKIGKGVPNAIKNMDKLKKI